MWIATIYGFFSVVCARTKDGAGKEIDTDTLMIRARRREHLDTLIRRFPEFLGAIEILETHHTDYRWRIICPKSVWAECMKDMVMEQTYPNFKSACEKRFEHHNPYIDVLHRVWSIMFKLQNTTK